MAKDISNNWEAPLFASDEEWILLNRIENATTIIFRERALAWCQKEVNDESNCDF